MNDPKSNAGIELMTMIVEIQMLTDVEFLEYWGHYMERLESASKLTGYPMPTALQLKTIKIDAFDGWRHGRAAEGVRMLKIFKEEIVNIANNAKLKDIDPVGYDAVMKSLGKFDDMVNPPANGPVKKTPSKLDPAIDQLFKNLGLDPSEKENPLDDGDDEQSFAR